MLPLMFIAACVDAGPTPTDTWPGFRNDGSSSISARDLPVSWSPKENVAWRATLPGYGQSSPVVWKDHYTGSMSGSRTTQQATSSSPGPIHSPHIRFGHDFAPLY